MALTIVRSTDSKIFYGIAVVGAGLAAGAFALKAQLWVVIAGVALSVLALLAQAIKPALFPWRKVELQASEEERCFKITLKDQLTQQEFSIQLEFPKTKSLINEWEGTWGRFVCTEIAHATNTKAELSLINLGYKTFKERFLQSKNSSPRIFSACLSLRTRPLFDQNFSMTLQIIRQLILEGFFKESKPQIRILFYVNPYEVNGSYCPKMHLSHLNFQLLKTQCEKALSF